MKLRIPGVCCLIFLVQTVLFAVELTPAVLPADLDAVRCQAFIDTKVVNTAPAGSIEAMLGLPGALEGAPVWTTGTGKGVNRHFRLAFQHPIIIGTICTTFSGPVRANMFAPYEGVFVSYLKPGVEYPGDVTDDAQWVSLPTGEVKILPPNCQVRALRFSQRATAPVAGDATFAPVVLLRDRYYNALNLGRSAVRPKGNNSSEVWTGSWNTSQALSGVVALPLQATRTRLEVLKPAVEAPELATTEQWLRQKDLTGGQGPSITAFDPPLQTTGIRLTALQAAQEQSFPCLIPLVKLGVAIDPPSLAAPPPPYRFTYEMPLTGFTAIQISDAKGKVIRHLSAETPRETGKVSESWDLKDDKGAPVPPGVYSWSGIARPPFTLTYENTVYNAGQPAWPAPPPGKGGGQWLGDHTPPSSVCAAGDLMFMGCQVCESGHTIIATDLNGNSVWSSGPIDSGFHGPDRIVSDGRFAYQLNIWQVQRIDPQHGFSTQKIFTFPYTRELPYRSGYWSPFNGGAAIRNGKLYVSFSGDAINWLQTSFLPEALDPTRCNPIAYLRKGGGHRILGKDPAYDLAGYDELMMLYGAFLTDSMPADTPSLAGIHLPSSVQAYFGDAPENGALAGTLTAAFKEPITLGSLLLSDGGAKVYALKPGAKLPEAGEGEPGDVDLGGGVGAVEETDPFDTEHWIPIPVQQGVAGCPAIALAPPKGLRTTALRFKTRRLTFALTLARRFEDVAPGAERVLGEGTVTKKGGWTFGRPAENPLTPYTPATMALVWKQPVTLRGVSLIHPITGVIAVDIWTGPETADPHIALDDDQYWTEKGSIRPEFIQWIGDPGPPTIRTIDFAELRVTRAVRIRYLRPQGCLNPYTDEYQSVPGAETGSIDGFVAYRYLGDDPEGLPKTLSDRITEIQLPAENEQEARLLRQLPFKRPGNLAVNAQGTLYAVSDGDIITVPLEEKDRSRVIIPKDQLSRPGGLAVDATGLIYVIDNGPNVVKVFDPANGKLLRTMGTPGGLVPGPWDGTRMDFPADLAVDKSGKVWVVNSTYQPKCVTRYSSDGKVEKTFLGPTQYGGGGAIDPHDRSVVNFYGMKFRINWESKDWKLESVLYHPGSPDVFKAGYPDRVVYTHGHRYLLGDGLGVSVICEERNNVAVTLAAAGNLGYWDAVDAYPALKKAFGRRDRLKYAFVWSDTNSDGKPQPDEVQVTDRNIGFQPGFPLKIGDDLSFTFPKARLRPSDVSPTGTPRYDMAKLEDLQLLDGQNYTTEDGRTFVVADRLLAPDGKTVLWEYPDDYLGGFGYHRSGFGFDRPAGVLNGEHQAVGHFMLGKEEYFATNSDQGDWYLFTGDGFLVGCIFGGPSGFGKRWWTMPRWEPGKVDLSDIRLPGEHYQGFVTKAEDGKVYAIAGHNFVGVVRVDGLEKLTRLPGGPLLVTKEAQQQTTAWEVEKAALEKQHQDTKIARVPRIEKGIQVNGTLDDWPTSLFVPVHEWIERSPFGMSTPHLDSQAALAMDTENLYLAVCTKLPMKNAGGDLKTLFKSGDAIELTLGLDAKADPKRRTPARGDVRILIARVKGNPVMVIYRPIDPSAKSDARTVFTSPVGEEAFASVTVIAEPEVAFGEETLDKKPAVIIEAAIPWQLLGLTAPVPGLHLRGDIGELVGDENGVKTMARHYWSGKSQTIVSDIPSESRLSPAVWGDLLVIEPEKDMKFGPEDIDVGGVGN